jgi:hypothetical protein
MSESVHPWWVLSTQLAWLAAFLIVAVGVTGAMAITAWQNRRLRRTVASAYGGLVEQFGPIVVAVPGKSCDLLVGPRFAHFFDAEEEIVFGSVAMQDITHLKIFEHDQDSIRFCLRLGSGIDTLMVETRSPVSFTDLFHQLTQIGKQVIYVPR